MVKQNVYIWVFKGAEFKNGIGRHLCRVEITPSSWFGLISVRGKLNPANSGGLNFRKYTPLHKITCIRFKTLSLG